MILISTVVLHRGQCCAILKVRVKKGIAKGGGAVREDPERTRAVVVTSVVCERRFATRSVDLQRDVRVCGGGGLSGRVGARCV